MNRIFATVKRGTTASSCCGTYAFMYARSNNIPTHALTRASRTTMLPLHLHQQNRWLAAKVKYNMKGFGPNGNMLKICFCYSEHDLYATPKTPNHEQYQYTKSRCFLSEIKEKTKEEFETCDDLEFFNGTEWQPLTKEKEIASFKGGEKVLNIRVPSRWDEFLHDYDTENPDDNEIVDPRNKDGSYKMNEVVRALILVCKLNDMTRSRVKPYHLQYSDQKEILTKQWVLDEAQNDALLRSILLRKPGTLDHIVECLHFDFTWRKLKDVDPKVNPSKENQVQYGNISRSYMM